MEEKKFVTREYLIKNGFERDTTSPLSVEDYFVKVRSKGGYIKFRFLPDEEIARGLYAYAENYDHANVLPSMTRKNFRLKTLPVSDYEKYDLGRFPNFDKSGSVMGMKNLYYGLDAKLVRCGNYIYNVSSEPEIYDAAH